MPTVEDLVIEREIEAVRDNARLHGWPFEWVGPRCFRVTLSARNGDTYQTEIECEAFPVQPAAFHWRNPNTGQLDVLADAPEPYNVGNNFFFPTGRICAPWNRLASTEGGPHQEWVQTNWMQQAETKGTVTLAAMVSRLHHELRSQRYRGRRKC